jgi:hypothetical protein
MRTRTVLHRCERPDRRSFPGGCERIGHLRALIRPPTPDVLGTREREPNRSCGGFSWSASSRRRGGWNLGSLDPSILCGPHFVGEQCKIATPALRQSTSCSIERRRPTAIRINSGRVYWSSGLVDTFYPAQGLPAGGIGMALLPIPSRCGAWSATETA